MSTSHRIDEIINGYPAGDVEDYFEHMNSLMQLNSGNNSYHMSTHVCHTNAAPLTNGTTQTHFHITDSGMDIVDMAKGLISLKISLDLEFRIGANETNLLSAAKLYESYYRNCCYFFVGFKSGSHIIKTYKIKSYGQSQDVEQTLSLPEQTIVYNSKAASERAARPGMYSPHEEVLKMSDCVCGAYIQQPIITGMTTKIPNVEFEVLIQLDDLLPFSGMTLYPNFICNELQLAIQCDLQKNMVFCPIPVETVFEKRMFTEPVELGKEFDAQFKNKEQDKTPSQISTFHLNTTQMINTQNMYSDFRFTQCGDYSRTCIGVTAYENLSKENVTEDSDFAGNAVYYTIVPTRFSINQAESYVYGFGLRDEAKKHLRQIFREQGVIRVPAQWVDQISFPQTYEGSNINANTNKSLFECDQIIITFPNSDYQMTCSRNPHLETFHVKVGNRINYPDLQMSTCDRTFSEATLSALSMDTLFAAPRSMINALTPNPNKRNDKFYGVNKEDDSDFMLVCDLERNGAGIYSDGVSGINVPIRFEATYLQGRNNPHFYEYDGNNGTYNLRKCSPLLFTVSDACWLLTENGPLFVKDANKRELTLQTEAKAQEEIMQLIQMVKSGQLAKMSAGGGNI